jgi:hypothetical protein
VTQYLLIDGADTLLLGVGIGGLNGLDYLWTSLFALRGDGLCHLSKFSNGKQTGEGETTISRVAIPPSPRPPMCWTWKCDAIVLFAVKCRTFSDWDSFWMKVTLPFVRSEIVSSDEFELRVRQHQDQPGTKRKQELICIWDYSTT